MPNQTPAYFAFNRGLVSSLALARVDQKRLSLSAETMDNMIAKVLGPMIFRPGLGYIFPTASSAAARYLKFIFGTSDTALLELTNLAMRVSINDVLLTRPAVTTAITNGTFAGNITSWTDGSDSGGSIAYVASNQMGLTSNGTARAIGYQQVTINTASTEHALRITIARGPVTLRVGTTLGDEDLVSEASLDQGTHSISFTPSTGHFFVQFSSTSSYVKLVSGCTIEAAGVVSITTPWVAADLGKVRYDQSGDIVYLAADGYQQRKIERRGTRPNARSWSVCLYQTDDGPFGTQNIGPITLTAAATTGDTTITASAPLFRSGHVGSLFAITTDGQTRTKAVAAQNTFSDSVRVTGLSRSLGISITGSLAAGSTVRLQRSADNATWSDVTGESWTTTAVSTSYDDALTNQTIYYRIGIKTGEYTGPDSVTCQLIFAAGSQRGVVRITAYSSSTSVSAAVLSELGGTAATDNWQEGLWSDVSGYPTTVRLHEGRLWWFGRNGVQGSVSDGFTSFDDSVIGDSGPIVRMIGSGPVDVINFALSLQRLLIGAEGKEVSVRSSAIDTPLTPTDFNMKDASTQGSAAVEAWKIDQSGIFVHRNGVKVYELAFSVQAYDYSASDLTEMCPELGTAGIVRIDVQRQPDTRLHCVLADGTVMLATINKAEDVLAWQTVSTDGDIEDVVVLPAGSGVLEDRVYYVVKRTINGSTVRYLEKWALETECRVGTYNKNVDAHVTVTNSPASTTVSGLSHLVGETVVVWADGAPILDSDDDPVEYTVNASGQITLGTAATAVTAGLYYEGQWKSAKLGVALSIIQSLISRFKRINKIGFLFAYFSRRGVRFGPDFDDANMRSMPNIEDGTTAPESATEYENDNMLFPSKWSPDARLCLLARAPMPLTVMAAVLDIEVSS